jgi:hypothetical protein
MAAAEKLMTGLDQVAEIKPSSEGYYDEKMRYIRNFKKAILIAIHGASKAFDKKLLYEQEVLNNISDMIIELYIAESTSLRVSKLEALKGSGEVALYKDILDVLVYDAADRIRKAGCDAVYCFADGNHAYRLANSMQSLAVVAGFNVKEARRRIAAKLTGDNQYKF